MRRICHESVTVWSKSARQGDHHRSFSGQIAVTRWITGVSHNQATASVADVVVGCSISPIANVDSLVPFCLRLQTFALPVALVLAR
jgi:hypothetical protein